MKMFGLLILVIVLMVKGQEPGTITNFEQVSSTADTIILGWNFTPGDLTFKRNDIVRNSDPPLPNFCPQEYCEQEFKYMETCGTYNFSITPYFVDPTDSSREVAGATFTTVGRTADEVPGSPRNLVVSDQTDKGVTIQWDEPSTFPQCTERYQVCSKLEAQNKICVETSDTSHVLVLELCAGYTVSVAAVTPSSAVGEAETISFFTIEGVPGPVIDLTVIAVGSNSVNVTFRRPEENPFCVEGYNYNFRPNYLAEDVASTQVRMPRREECDPCYASFSPLNPCTSYTLTINGYNPSLVNGAATLETVETEEVEPMEPKSLITESLGPDKIAVTWTGNEKDSCGEDAEICWVDDIHPSETCQGYQQGSSGGSLMITDLLPCTLYTVTVVFRSPGGLQSPPLSNHTHTDYIVPNPVENLALTNITANTVTYTFSYPLNQEQCVNSHEILVENLDEESVIQQSETLHENMINMFSTDDPPTKTEFEDGLESCTNYRISVRTVSPSGLVSSYESITFLTLEALPGQPRGLEERYTDETSISFVFYQPLDNPSCATAYKIRWESSSDEIGEKYHIPEYPLPFQMNDELQGLEPCTEHTITVTAIGALTGESEISDSLLIMTDGCTT